jgi:hypothetical protein
MGRLTVILKEPRLRGEHLPRQRRSRLREDRVEFFLFINIKCCRIVIPIPRTSLILLVSCPTRGRFLEAIPSADGAKAGRTGGPRNGRRPEWPGGAPGGAAPALGARGLTLPREAGTLLPPQGCPLVPWRLPPLHPLAWVSRGSGKARTHCAARARKLGLGRDMMQCMVAMIGVAATMTIGPCIE